MSYTSDSALIAQDEWLSPQEAAAFLRKSPTTLSRWRTEQKGPSFAKIGGSVSYRRSDLEDYRLRCRKLVPTVQAATAVSQ
jgi:Helix-turn-helix domain